MGFRTVSVCESGVPHDGQSSLTTNLSISAIVLFKRALQLEHMYSSSKGFGLFFLPDVAGMN